MDKSKNFSDRKIVSIIQKNIKNCILSKRFFDKKIYHVLISQVFSYITILNIFSLMKIDLITLYIFPFYCYFN